MNCRLGVDLRNSFNSINFKRIRFLALGISIVFLARSLGIVFLINVINVSSKDVIDQNLSLDEIGSWESILFDNQSILLANKKFDKDLDNTIMWLKNWIDVQSSTQYLDSITSVIVGDYEGAIELLNFLASENHQRKGLSSYFLGIAYILSGYPNQAIEAWSRSPEISQLLLRTGTDSFYNRADYDSAMELFTVAKEINPASCEPRYRLAQSWIEIGQPEQAFLILEDVESRECTDSSLAEIYYLRGKILSETGDANKAIQELRKAVSLDSDDAKKLSLLGNLIAKTNPHSEEAFSLLEKALILSPENIWNYLNLCNFERRRNSFSAALDWCNLVIEKFPEIGVAYHTEALVYLDQHDFNEAIDRLNKALQFDAKNINTWNRLGDAYRGKGELTLALEAYSSALKIDSKNNYALQRKNELMNR